VVVAAVVVAAVVAGWPRDVFNVCVREVPMWVRAVDVGVGGCMCFHSLHFLFMNHVKPMSVTVCGDPARETCVSVCWLCSTRLPAAPSDRMPCRIHHVTPGHPSTNLMLMCMLQLFLSVSSLETSFLFRTTFALRALCHSPPSSQPFEKFQFEARCTLHRSCSAINH
jgi:hypothetical protein